MQSDMKLISVNVGLPRVVMSHGDPVSTGIFKEPVADRVTLRTLNLDGERSPDLGDAPKHLVFCRQFGKC